ncbi:MAG TPA: DUF5060 domain-containing protein [bacterium]|nr:DUF5060 domain-containing protein [bacterium]HPN44736.1 DUF5060 domain-containing protein [bacterium]
MIRTDSPLRVLILFIVFLLAGNLQAKIMQFHPLTKEIRQYEKAEWDITLQADWDDPFHAPDVALDMALLSPAGRELILPCFYVSGESGGESHWQARFTPREAGAYQYFFRLSDNSRIVDATAVMVFSCTTSGKRGFLNNRDLWSLQFDNGEIYRGIGENICWEARSNDDSKYFRELHENKKFNYRDMLITLKTNGGDFFRTWMIYWNLPVDWKTVRNSDRYQNSTARFNESGIKRMDELVNLCDSLGVYLMLALDSHAGYTGYGWDMNNYNIKNGGYAATPAEFFILQPAREQYKDKLRYMVARWGYSPAIAAWEFFNEIDNVMYAGPAENRIPDAVITEWHREMSEYLKDIDPYQHLVTTSISHRDVQGLNDIEYIDVNQKHIYKNTAAIPATINEYTRKHGKPYIIGEFGYEWDWQKNFDDFGAEMDSDFKRGLWYGLFSPTPVLPMSWWWEYFDYRGMNSYFARVREIHNHMLNMGKGDYRQTAVTVSSSDIQALGVQCGSASYVYLFNPQDKEFTTTVTLDNPFPGIIHLQYYDCETGTYQKMSDLRPVNEKMVVKDFTLKAKTDVVLIGITR